MPIPAVPPQGEAQLNENARTVISKRYLIKDATGTPMEQPEDMFWRVAGTVAEADRRYGASDNDVSAMAENF
jgi:ribonucleoside-diphosphate reductase alpha chain